MTERGVPTDIVDGVARRPRSPGAAVCARADHPYAPGAGKDGRMLTRSDRRLTSAMLLVFVLGLLCEVGALSLEVCLRARAC